MKSEAKGSRKGAVLVIGADGTIGRNLAAALEDAGEKVWKTTRRPDQVSDKRIFLDLSHDMEQWPLPPRVGTAVFCAGVTSMEKCRLDPEGSRRVNVAGTVALARRLANAGTFIVFISTNQVFDGVKPFAGPNDAIKPSSEYGRQKAEVEQQLLSQADRAAVIRLNKVISPDAPLFRGWIDDLKAGKTVHPFSDMVIAPISLSFAMKVLLQIAESAAPGIFQASAKQDMSYAAMARYIADKLGAAGELVQPVSYRAAGVYSAPANTSLDSGRLVELGLEAPDAVDALAQFDISA